MGSAEIGGIFGSLKRALAKSSEKISDGLANIFGGGRAGDDKVVELLEELLLGADVGVAATDQIVSDLRIKGLLSGDIGSISPAIAESIADMIRGSGCCGTSMLADLTCEAAPRVVMLCGMNGSGKTTTVGKLANLIKAGGNSVAVAACDTFRAAAAEQLIAWGKKVDIPVFVGKANADPASVAYAGYTAAETDFFIVDTAGRMHNQTNLMDELIKIERTIKKLNNAAPHKTIVVVDGNTGQNAVKQVESYMKSIRVDGLIVTKLDGTSRGGIILNLIMKFKIPVYYVCLGEKTEDIAVFDPDDFASSIVQ